MKLSPRARTILENTAVIVGMGLIVLLIGNVISFATSRNVLPPETRLGDVDVTGLTIDDAISKTVTALNMTVTMRYGGEEIALNPAAVDFRLNRVVAELQLREVIDAQQGIGQLPAFMLRQHIRNNDLPLPYLYAEPKLQAELDGIAQRIDREPRPPQPDVNTGAVAAGGDGQLLNRADATTKILGALSSSIARRVDLPVDVVPLGAASVKTIEPQIAERLSAFTGAEGNIAGVFIKDLQTGEELSINGDVAFSGAGWARLAVATEGARMNAADAAALVAIAGAGDMNAINPVLQTLGNGDLQLGVDAVNAMLNRLGLRNTFLAQQFFSSVRPPSIVTPANSRGDINASPDPNAQSTVADAGVLMEMLWQCSNGEGAMLLAMGDENPFTADTCKAVLDAVASSPFNGLIKAGSGNAQVIQRLNWDPNNHGATALVQAGDRSYIVSVLLHSPGALDWANTSPIITDIARIANGFFSGQMPAPVPPLTSPPNAS
jgi:hypothetical protein